MSSLLVQPVKTPILRRGDSLTDFVLSSVDRSLVQEKMLLAVTSKIVSLAEGRLVAQKDVADKTDLIRRESDHYLGAVAHGCHLTIKEGLFIASAGIDESNSEDGDFILYPADPFASTEKLWRELRSAWGLREMGVIMTDSHTTPLRKGVTGISLAHWGFKAIQNLVGTPDLFGRDLKVTTVNWADGLGAAAVVMMGEGNESTPLALLKGARVEFTDQSTPGEVRIPVADDLYFPFFKTLL